MMTPDDLGWGPPCPSTKITTFSAGGISLTAHKEAAPIFAAFIEDIVRRGYSVVGPIPDDWGYNCRRIAGSNTWSWHAWGMAIDLNALKNPMGPTLVTDMPPWIDEVAGRYGLVWGGNFNRRKDAMHFEMHLTPMQAATMRRKLEDTMGLADIEAINKHTDEIYRLLEHGTPEPTSGRRDHLSSIVNQLLSLKAEVAELRTLIEVRLPAPPA
jgi:hypothetical protein